MLQLGQEKSKYEYWKSHLLKPKRFIMIIMLNYHVLQIIRGRKPVFERKDTQKSVKNCSKMSFTNPVFFYLSDIWDVLYHFLYIWHVENYTAQYLLLVTFMTKIFIQLYSFRKSCVNSANFDIIQFHSSFEGQGVTLNDFSRVLSLQFGACTA